VTNWTRLTVIGENIPNPAVFANPGAIAINDAREATPYPSGIDVNCVPGPIDRVVVTLVNLNHTFPGDIAACLAGPGGQAIVLMAGAGKTYRDPTNAATLVFSSEAATRLPESGDFGSGAYLPSNYGLYPPSSFPGLTGAIGLTNLTGFRGASPNGPWGLYVLDEQTLDFGAIEGGWTLEIHWQDTRPRLSTPVCSADGPCHVTLSGVPGIDYVIEASPNLKAWVPVSTNRVEDVSATVPLPAWPGSSQLFYRAVCWPCQ